MGKENITSVQSGVLETASSAPKSEGLRTNESDDLRRWRESVSRGFDQAEIVMGMKDFEAAHGIPNPVRSTTEIDARTASLEDRMGKNIVENVAELEAGHPTHSIDSAIDPFGLSSSNLSSDQDES